MAAPSWSGGRDDRHQFRFIVSSEDGAELSDLRTTTRDLVQQMEMDLGTKLDWIAVDHATPATRTPISSWAG
jgi:type IV secretory pathway VirD2 relaxase